MNRTALITGAPAGLGVEFARQLADRGYAPTLVARRAEKLHEVATDRAAGMMEMKNSLPDFLWYDAQTVVREGLKALEQGKTVFCAGRLYRVLDALTQFGPTRWLLKRTVIDGLTARRAKAESDQ